MRGGSVRAGRRVKPLDVFVRALAVPVLGVRPVRVHVAGHVGGAVRAVLHLAVQPQTVPPLGAVRAEAAGERTLPRVHAHVFHQLVGRPRQVAAAVAAVLVALAMTLEVDQELLLLGKRPLADAAAVLGGALLRLGCQGDGQSSAGGGGKRDRASGSQSC